MSRPSIRAIWLAALLLVCGARADADLGLFELPNYFEYSTTLASSGQPAADQFEPIHAAGVRVVIDLVPRDAAAVLPDEAAIARAAGLRYEAIPVDWHAPRDETLARFFAVMDEVGPAPVLVHCRQGARAASFVYLYRVLRMNAEPREARKVLDAAWQANPGQTLDEAPQWAAFIERAQAAGPPARAAQ